MVLHMLFRMLFEMLRPGFLDDCWIPDRLERCGGPWRLVTSQWCVWNGEVSQFIGFFGKNYRKFP